jgi:hypothetical protein
MLKFIEKYNSTITMILLFFLLIKGCSDGRELSKIRKDVDIIKDSTYTKTELKLILKSEGLRAEKRMIQSTDRKMLDVLRQSAIDQELNDIENKIKK